MGTLAHAFEAAGLSTIVLSSIREVTERIRPPRALHAEFPLGHPLGRPRDAALQHRVLEAAFALLDAPSGPVLVDFPESVSDEDAPPLTCALPPRYDPNLHPAIDEAQALRSAYERALVRNRRTSVGRAISAAEIPEALARFARIVDGEAWDRVGFEAPHMQIATDIRSYYEELAAELADPDAIASWSAERWFFEHTEAGRLVLATREALKRTGAPFEIWFHMAPGSRQGAMTDLKRYMGGDAGA